MLAFINAIGLFFYLLMYFIFRDGVKIACKISHKKKLKGWKNYWWLESLREIKYLGRFYVINKVFICFYALSVLVTVPLSFFPNFRVVVIAFNAIIGAALIPMTLFGVIQSNKKNFGRSFVWLKRLNNGKFHSSVIDAGFCFLPIFIIILECVVWFYLFF